jgi:hypothetical protein
MTYKTRSLVLLSTDVRALPFSMMEPAFLYPTSKEHIQFRSFNSRIDAAVCWRAMLMMHIVDHCCYTPCGFYQYNSRVPHSDSLTLEENDSLTLGERILPLREANRVWWHGSAHGQAQPRVCHGGHCTKIDPHIEASCLVGIEHKAGSQAAETRGPRLYLVYKKSDRTMFELAGPGHFTTSLATLYIFSLT